MSFDLRSNREISSDPFGRFLADLSKRLSAFLAKDQAELVENPEDIFADAQDLETVLKWHNFVMTKKFPVSPTNVQYYSATEPDNDKVKLMLGKLWPNLGSELIDSSGYDNNALIQGGEPVLVDGAPFNPGVVDGITTNVKSIAIRFNRPASEFTNDEYMSVPDCTDLFVSGLVTGISYFIRFRISSLSQQDGINRTLFEKVDDSTPSNGVVVSVSDTGNLRFHIKRAGVEYNNQTAAGTIAVNTVYDVFLTYAVSGNVSHIYVNNVDKSLTGAGSPTWHSTLTNHDISIFRRGAGTTGGYTYGDFYSMMVFREKVVSATEVGRHFTNKLTLANIPFGQVAISNYSATNGIALARVSLSRTYKWNVLGLTRISKSMTLKYNIVGRISASKRLKWNIFGTPSSTSFTTTSFSPTSFTT